MNKKKINWGYFGSLILRGAGPGRRGGHYGGYGLRSPERLP